MKIEAQKFVLFMTKCQFSQIKVNNQYFFMKLAQYRKIVLTYVECKYVTRILVDEVDFSRSNDSLKCLVNTLWLFLHLICCLETYFRCTLTLTCSFISI